MKDFLPLLNDARLASRPIEARKTKVIVLDEGWFDWGTAFEGHPEYTVVTVPTSDIEEYVIREILLERDFVVLVRLAWESSGEHAITVLKGGDWGQDIFVIGIVPESGLFEWNKWAAGEADLVLAQPLNPVHLDAALKKLFTRKRQGPPIQRDAERKEMGELLQKEWMRFVRFQTTFSLAYVKLDEFAYLLQSFGVKKVLTFYGQMYLLAKQTIRNYDEIKWWRANAFVVLFPMSRSAGAEIAAERMLGPIEKIPNADLFFPFVRIGIIESEHGYSSAEDIIIRLEGQLAIASVHAPIHLVPSLQDYPGQQSQRMKLLIVDEDVVAPTILSNHLSPDEWRVEICTNGAEAIDRAAEFRPDVILSEMSMAGMNGYEFCVQVRQILSSKQTAFLFFSKQSTASNILRGLQAGADDFISKPFSASVVEAKMRRHVSIRK